MKIMSLKLILDDLLLIFGDLLLFAVIIFVLLSIGLSSKTIKTMRRRMIINRNIKVKRIKWEDSPIFNHYHRILLSTLPRYEGKYFLNTILMQFLFLFALLFSVFIVTHSFIFSSFTGLFFGFFIPYIVLRVKLKRLQTSAQSNMTAIVMKLLQSYRSNYHNINYAMIDLVGSLKGTAKVIFGTYFMRIKSDITQIELASETFSMQIGNDFGDRLAILMMRAHEGIDIETNLEDLSEDIHEFQKRIRDHKTEGREVSWLGYLPIFATPTYMLLMSRFIPDGKAFHYYFQTPLGLKSFVISVVAALIGLFFATVFSKPKQSL